MLGLKHFKVIEPAEVYELSNGQALNFLSRSDLAGVTNEEVIGVLLDRLREQGRRQPSKETSRAITALEGVEEILWRREIQKKVGNSHALSAA